MLILHLRILAGNGNTDTESCCADGYRCDTS